MRLKQPDWTRILTILLVILASFAILYIMGTVLARFKQPILLFSLGAMTAYVLSPLVNRLERAVHFRWLAIVLAYLLAALAIGALGLLLVTPFIQQAQSLVDNLHDPSPSSLKTIVQVQTDSAQLHRDLTSLERAVVIANTLNVSGNLTSYKQQIAADIGKLQADTANLRTGTVAAPANTRAAYHSEPAGRVPPNPGPQTQVPPSYVATIQAPVNQTVAHYQQAIQAGSTPDLTSLRQAIAAVGRTTSAAKTLQHTVSTTPILLLRSQTWLDGHNLRLDLSKNLGQAAGQASNQGTNILNNAITIVSATGRILLDITLILIISVYLLSDGRRLTRRGLELVPTNLREQVWYFVQSLDQVLGGYIRGTLLLSTLAGILGGGGAAVLGVPYPLLIGIATFLLQFIPVIGPMVALLPAVIISLFFMPLKVTVLLVVWFLVFQQIVTNFVGPRVLGSAVGIHPLEALLAVLVGYPIGGLLGAFLAVPLMGVLHILLRETYAYFVLGHALPAATVPAEMEATQEYPVTPPAQPPQPLPPRAKTDSAAS